MLTRIDKIFKEYAIEKYGDIFSDAQIEEARVYAFNKLSELTTKTMQKQPEGTTKNLFLEYLGGINHV